MRYSNHNRKILVTRFVYAPCVTLLFLWPALWNGYPLLEPDTKRYLVLSLYREFGSYFSPFYGYLLNFPPQWISLWGVAAFQAVTLSWLLYEFLRAQELSSDLSFVLMAACATLSGAAITVSRLSPDVFLTLVPLSLAVELVDRNYSRLPRRIALLASFALGCLGQQSHPLIAGLVLSSLFVFRKPLSLEPRRLVPFVCTLLSVLVAQSLTTVRITHGSPRIALSEALLAKAHSWGLLKPYLVETCPHRPNPLCALPPSAEAEAFDKNYFSSQVDRFIWGTASPLSLARNQPDSHRNYWPDLMEIGRTRWQDVLGGLASELIATLWNRPAPDQEQLRPLAGHPVYRAVAETFPGDRPALEASRQKRGNLWLVVLSGQVARWVNGLCWILVILCHGNFLKGAARLRIAFVTLISITLANAAICSALSSGADRFMARLDWLALPLGFLGILSWYRSEEKARSLGLPLFPG